MALSKIKFKAQKNLNALEPVAAFFCNWGVPPSPVLSSF
jgi:hypothetical protein